MAKKHRFFYHYRRSSQGMTVHYRGQCIPCKNVRCHVPTETKWNKQQPLLVIQGFASCVEIVDGEVTIR